MRGVSSIGRKNDTHTHAHTHTRTHTHAHTHTPKSIYISICVCVCVQFVRRTRLLVTTCKCHCLDHLFSTKYLIVDMMVSIQAGENSQKNSGMERLDMIECGAFLDQGYPQIIHLNRIFHYKPSILDILGYLFRKPPCGYGFCTLHPGWPFSTRSPRQMSERPQLEDSNKFWQKLVNVGLEDGFFSYCVIRTATKTNSGGFVFFLDFVYFWSPCLFNSWRIHFWMVDTSIYR